MYIEGHLYSGTSYIEIPLDRGTAYLRAILGDGYGRVGLRIIFDRRIKHWMTLSISSSLTRFHFE